MFPARVADQQYCSKQQCQQARKNAWSKSKYIEDSDYRENQKASTQAWLVSQGGAAAYYREYRKRRKAEAKQASLKAASSEGDLCAVAAEKTKSAQNANRDARNADRQIKSGRYVIFPVHAYKGTNKDAIVAEIYLISDG